MRNIQAVFTKQVISYAKNPGRWGAPVTFLIIPFVFMMISPDINRALITIQFVIMFVGMSMVMGAAAVIMEDRATQNLRFMAMAGVKPHQYLIATCGVLLIVSFVALVLFGMISGHSGVIMKNFLIITMLGATCSMLLGITLGLSKLAPFAWIVGILLGIGPVLAVDFGVDALTRAVSATYTYQIIVALRGNITELPDVTSLYELAAMYNLTDLGDLRAFQRDLRVPRDLAVLPVAAVRIMLINAAVILAAFVAINIRTRLDGKKL